MGELPVYTETALIKARTLNIWQPPFVKRDASPNAAAQFEDNVEEWRSFASPNPAPVCNRYSVKDPWHTENDVKRVAQIINNIVLNVVRSMQEGGIIKISAENQKIEELSPSGLKPGDYIRICIKEEEIKLIKYHGRILAMDNMISLRNTVKRSLKGISHERIDIISSSRAIHEYKRAEESGQAYDDSIVDMTI